MESTDAPESLAPEIAKPPSAGVLQRVFRYTLFKALTLFLSVVIGLYLTILVINLGGYVDEIFRSQITESISAQIKDGWLRLTPEPERTQIINQTTWDMEEARGLHQPFALRSLRWLVNSLTLDLGNSSPRVFYTSYSGPIRNVVLQYLPITLAITGSANLLSFFASILLALGLARQPGSRLDRVAILLSPLTSAPGWVHGIILLFIFASQLHILPFPRNFNFEQMPLSWAYVPVLLKHSFLPVTAIFLSTFFQSAYSWRTFFLIYLHEDYVEVARAKGLPAGMLERRYVLRPTLPYILTSFAMLLIGMWQSAIAIEILFNWPGIGALFILAVRSMDIPLSLGVVVIFAYILAFTIFVLEILYALVDPRVRIGSQNPALKVIQGRKFSLFQPPPAKPTASRLFTGSTEIASPAAAPRLRPSFAGLQRSWRRSAHLLSSTLSTLTRYPSALVGLLIILLMIGTAVYTIFALPYQQAVALWRVQGSDWYRLPEIALPEWVNFFRLDKLPKTIILGSRQPGADANIETISEDISRSTIEYTFDYPYDELPSDLVLFLNSDYAEKPPYLTLAWRTPDGRELDLGGFAAKSMDAYYLSRDAHLQRKLGGESILEALFARPNSQSPRPLKGSYTLKITQLMFEPDSRVNAEFVLYGKVHGLAGTDNKRRDLMVALLWGAPTALAFGLLGAFCTSLLAMLLAAASAWYSGWVDGLIQRLTEINLILPTLPIAILVFTMYSKSIWVILGVVVLLNIFGSAIKNYRAVFLQVKESPYVEAARAYGASDGRIIWQYLVPRILPILIPQLVIMVPNFVFYEATLAYLGISDPDLPTWGKLIYDGLTSGVLERSFYWVLEPVILLILTSLGFALLGFALDRILNPRLREV